MAQVVIATGFDENNRRPTPISFASLDEPVVAPHRPTLRPMYEPEPQQETRNDMGMSRDSNVDMPEPEPVAIRKPLFKPKPVEPVGTMNDDDLMSGDELDIPAFIRKKMK